MESVLSIVTSIVTDHLGAGEVPVTPESRLIEDLGADSLDCLEIVIALEERFGIDIPDNLLFSEDGDILKTETVQDLANLVEKIQNETV